MKTLIDQLNDLPVATLLVATITVIVGVVGGVVTITDAERLGFQEYVTVMTGLAGANGLLGIGRGLKRKPPGET